MIILLLVVLRILWRLAPRTRLAAIPAWQQRLARSVQAVPYTPLILDGRDFGSMDTDSLARLPRLPETAAIMRNAVHRVVGWTVAR